MGKLDLNHFCPQNPSSAKVNEAIKRDNEDKNKITFDQQDLHLGRKWTQAENLGYIKDFIDGLCTIVNISILSLIVEVKTSKESIFPQLMSRFARFFPSHPFTTWATKPALKKLQLPFAMIHYGKQTMVSLARDASTHAVTSMIDDGTYDIIPMRHYKQAVMASNDCFQLVSSLMRSDAKLTMVPESTPEKFDPKFTARKRMQAEVTKEVAASLASRPHARRHILATPDQNQRPAQGATQATSQPN